MTPRAKPVRCAVAACRRSTRGKRYCADCAAERYRRQRAEYMRRKRGQQGSPAYTWRRVTPLTAELIRETAARGVRVSEIARDFERSRATVLRILRESPPPPEAPRCATRSG